MQALFSSGLRVFGAVEVPVADFIGLGNLLVRATGGDFFGVPDGFGGDALRFTVLGAAAVLIGDVGVEAAGAAHVAFMSK